MRSARRRAGVRGQPWSSAEGGETRSSRDRAKNYWVALISSATDSVVRECAQYRGEIVVAAARKPERDQPFASRIQTDLVSQRGFEFMIVDRIGQTIRTEQKAIARMGRNTADVGSYIR